MQPGLNKGVIFVFFLLVSFSVFADKNNNWEPYSIIDSIPIKNITSAKKVFKQVEKWFDSEKGQVIVRKNTDKYIIQGKGFFIYYNYVSVENVFLSPRANERTTGNILFTVNIEVTDSMLIAKFSNFTHEAYYSQYGKISFGRLLSFETTPPGRCLENKEWCNAVWTDMKSRSEIEIEDRISRILPDGMIRKKGQVYKKPAEKEVEVDTVKKDPKDYLNLDNYLIKE